MAFAKGRQKTGGKTKGSVNKSTKTAKEAFQFAFDKLGGPEGLVRWAQKDPDNEAAFYTLYARLIPTDVTSGGKTLAAPIIGLQVVGKEA